MSNMNREPSTYNNPINPGAEKWDTVSSPVGQISYNPEDYETVPQEERDADFKKYHDGISGRSTEDDAGQATEPISYNPEDYETVPQEERDADFKKYHDGISGQ